MKDRKKLLISFLILYIIFTSVMFFGLKQRYQKYFSNAKLSEMISGKSVFRDITTDLCKYQILGDPKEVGNYIKLSFSCLSGKKVTSTVSLSAVEDKTVAGFIKEYARIIGFDPKVLTEKKFLCYLDGKLLTVEMQTNIIRPTATLDCYEDPEL